MRVNRWLSFLVTMTLTAAVLPVSAQAAHPGGPVPLLDGAGNFVAVGSATPYSPKKTCSAFGCHNITKLNNGMQPSDSIYETGIGLAGKDHGAGSLSYDAPYETPYPLHGVSAGYHFQQGRNAAWGDTQRSFYGLPAFTSSPGMYGKY